MKSSSTTVIVIVLALLGLGIYQLGKDTETAPLDSQELTEERFEGTLSEVNTGCFFDAECYLVVDGKKVTLVQGWSQEEVGQIIGSPDGIGGLESVIGQTIEVYAAKIDSSTYTLYGNEAYFVSVKK